MRNPLGVTAVGQSGDSREWGGERVTRKAGQCGTESEDPDQTQVFGRG